MSNKFDIKIFGKVFESDDDGFLNLNDISRAFDLKPPSQWRTKERRALEEDAKLHSLKNNTQDKGQARSFMVGDEDATIFYAMYISYEFGLEVVTAFRNLRQGKLDQAIDHATNTMSESSANKMKDLVWENIGNMKVINQRTALQVAGIEHPIVFMREIRKRPKTYVRLQEEGKIISQTYAPNKWTDRFTQDGFQWLLDNNEKMNQWVDEVRH